jgi:hypothetical protein
VFITWAVVLATMNWWWPCLFGEDAWDEPAPRRAGAAAKSRLAEAAGSFAGVVQRAEQKALASRLQSLRCSIDMYMAQHGGRCPGVLPDGRFVGATFARQLTGRTNAEGDVVSRRRPKRGYPFGPYIRHVPANPFVRGPRAARVAGGPGGPPRDAATGWWIDTTSGTPYANHSEGAQP